MNQDEPEQHQQCEPNLDHPSPTPPPTLQTLPPQFPNQPETPLLQTSTFQLLPQPSHEPDPDLLDTLQNPLPPQFEPQVQNCLTTEQQQVLKTQNLQESIKSPESKQSEGKEKGASNNEEEQDEEEEEKIERKESSKSYRMMENQFQGEDQDEDGGVIVTSQSKGQGNNQTPSQASKQQQSLIKSGGGGSGVGSYHMQQNLQVSSQLTKAIFDSIKKGDIGVVKRDQEKIGIELSKLVDDGYKHNALFYATQIKDEHQSLKMIEYLVSQGVDPLLTDTLNQSVIFYASRDGKVSTMKYLLSLGCIANHVDSNGQTPIFYAAREGHVQACQILFEGGANPDIVDNNEQTPLYYAVRGGKIETVKFLIEKGVNVSHEDKKQQTPMHIAKRSNKQQIMNLLMDHGAKPLEELRKLTKQREKQNQIEKIQQLQIHKQQSASANLMSSQGTNSAIEMPKGNSGQFVKKNSINPTGLEKKQAKRYVLTVLKDGVYEPLSNEELDRFEVQFPEIAKFWLNPQTLEQINVPKVSENTPIYESWDKAAKRLLNQLWKCSQAWIFHEPVDPDKLGIPDYFEVVKTPMDFGTIKERLNSNYYHRLQEFLNDIELVFHNCVLFNGDDSPAGKMCRSVRDEFRRLYDMLNLDFYLQ